MKKIFRLSAMVAMISMMDTAVCVSSCSDDDDEDEPEPTPAPVYTKTFSGEVGGKNSSAGSFISVQDGEIYRLSEITNDAAKASHVEIVFDGKKFVGANNAVNDVVNQNGCGATIIKKDGKYEFRTNGGENGTDYSGVIEVISGELSGDNATVKIKVSAK